MEDAQLSKVQVQYVGLIVPDMNVFNATLTPFARLSEAQIATVLPVEIHWPKTIAQRIATLSRYATGAAPSGTTAATIDSVRNVVEQMIPAEEAAVERAVRLMAAAAVRDDGSRAVAERTAALSAYLEAKAFAMARTLNSYVLVQEPPLEWGADFRALGRVYSPHVIYGLVPLGRRLGSWAGWTDADLKIEQERFRVSMPILAEGPRSRSDAELTPEEMRFLIVPQLLDKRQMTYTKVRAVAFGPWTSFCRDLTFRNEVFFDCETCDDHPEAGNNVARIAACRIVEQLNATPPANRRRAYMELTMPVNMHGLDVTERVRQAVTLD